MNTPFGKFLSGKLFVKLFLILNIASVIYVSYANSRAFGCFLESITVFACFFAFYLFICFFFVLAKSYMRKLSIWKNRALIIVSGFITCYIIYDLLALILWDISAALLDLPEKIHSAGVLCAGLICAAAVVGGYLHTKKIKSISYTIDIGAEKSMRIALVSDIHLGAFVRNAHVKKIVDKINEIDADITVICGDITDSDNCILDDSEELEKISEQFRRIHSKEGIYAVLGNHDPKVSNEVFIEFLKSSGIRLLHNDCVQLSGICLAGRTNGANNFREEAKKFYQGFDKRMICVALDHDPAGIPEAVEAGMDLVLCGHTHKGQFFPSTLFTKWANGKDYFYGYMIFGKTHAVITSGAGFFQLPIRVATNNEVVSIFLE